MFCCEDLCFIVVLVWTIAVNCKCAYFMHLFWGLNPYTPPSGSNHRLQVVTKKLPGDSVDSWYIEPLSHIYCQTQQKFALETLGCDWDLGFVKALKGFPKREENEIKRRENISFTNPSTIRSKHSPSSLEISPNNIKVWSILQALFALNWVSFRLVVFG